ncbi:MAG TPA: DUF5654 family protein [Candidatus Methylomirabilis sp.]|nr:DUF5654 family protein [Candidatus Methylomirabilis sp.]
MQNGNAQQKEDVRLLVLQRTYELLMGAFTFVAALAWNEAIQGLFLRIFGPQQTVVAKFLYAVLLTVIIVYLGSRATRVTRLIEERLKRKPSSDS